MADPKRPEFTAEQLQEARRLQSLYPDKQGALLPVLRMAQEVFGYVSLEVEEYVATTKLASMGIAIDTMTADQKKYSESWEHGT